MPIIPLVVTPEDAGIQDSTPIMLRAIYAGAEDKAALDPVLEAAGCLAGLRG